VTSTIHPVDTSDHRIWSVHARRNFRPGKRQPCAICGKYRSLAQAHHLIPLSKQEGDSPNQAFVWLCPNHHAAVHLLISQSVSKRGKAGQWQIELINELEPGEWRRVLEIFESFRRRQ